MNIKENDKEMNKSMIPVSFSSIEVKYSDEKSKVLEEN